MHCGVLVGVGGCFGGVLVGVGGCFGGVLVECWLLWVLVEVEVAVLVAC